MKKKNLLISILILILPLNIVYAETSLSTLFEKRIDIYSLDKSKFLFPSEFDKYIKSEGLDLYNRRGKKVSVDIYNYYGLIVYTDYNTIKTSRKKEYPLGSGNYEYEYLGENSMGEKYANPDFPRDANSGNAPYNWNYIKTTGADITWKELNKFKLSTLKKYILNATLYHHGVDTKLTASSSVFGNDRENKILLQSIPTLFNGGTVKVSHKTSAGKIYYAVFDISKMSGSFSLNADINLPKGTNYSANSKIKYVEVPINITTTVNLGGNANSTMVKSLKQEIVKVNDKLVSGLIKETSASTKLTNNYIIKIPVKDLKEGKNTVKIETKSTFKSIFDRDKIKEKIVSKTITIVKGEFQAVLNGKIEPDKIELSKLDYDNNKETEVTVTLDASESICPSKVDYYQFYNGEETDYNKALKEGNSPIYNFKLKVSRSKELKYKVRIYDKETNKFSIAYAKVNINVYKKGNNVVSASKGDKPNISLSSENEVLLGDEITIRTYVEDDDGDITKIWYDAPSSMVGRLGEGSRKVQFGKIGKYTVTGYVEDSFGQRDKDVVKITVLKPMPYAVIKEKGDYKELQTVELDAGESEYSGRYPINFKKTKWEISPISGLEKSDIVVDGSLEGRKKIRVSFKKIGKVKISLTVENSLGYTHTKEIEREVKEDISPIAELEVTEVTLRNPEDNKNAIIDIYDKSYSLDGDDITKRVYLYAYDSDNDGEYRDEGWYVYENKSKTWINVGNYKKRWTNIDLKNFNSGNEKHLKLKKDKVGRYFFTVRVYEEHDNRLSYVKFNQIKNSISSDVKSEIDNASPVVSLDVKAEKDKIVDLVIITDYKKEELSKLKNEINNIKAKYFNEGVKINAKYITEKVKIGKQEIKLPIYRWSRRIKVEFKKDGTIRGGSTNSNWDKDFKGELSEIYVNYEYKNSKEKPSIEEFKKSKEIKMKVQAYDEGEKWGMFGGGRKRGKKIIFYDSSNYALTKVEHKFNNRGYYQGINFAYMNDYSIEEIKYTPINTWKRENIVEYEKVNKEVYSLDVSKIKEKELEGESEKILLIFAEDGEYSAKSSKAYSFGILNKEIMKEIYEEGFKTYLITDNSKIKKFKYNDKRENYQREDGIYIEKTYSKQEINLGELIENNPNNEEYRVYSKKTWKENLDKIFDIKEKIKEKEVMIFTKEEEIKFKTMYLDYENDEKGEEEIIYKHEPNYYENSEGKISSKVRDEFLKELLVGKYKVSYRVKDKASSNKNFRNYNKFSNLEEKIFLVHRKPVAKFKLIYKNNGRYKKIKYEDDGSYDLDHISEKEKGILEREYYYKIEGGRWNKVRKKEVEFNVEDGKMYFIKYRVKDKEGEWSDYIIDFKDVSKTPIKIKAKLKGKKYNKNSIPVTEELIIYDIKTESVEGLDIKIEIYSGNKLIKTIKEYRENRVGEVKHKNIIFKVPKTLTDGKYKVKIEAKNSTNEEKIELNFAVNTPINLKAEIEKEMRIGNEYKIKASTSKYVDEVKMKIKIYEEGEMKLKEISLENKGIEKGKKKWEYEYKVDERSKGGIYKAVFKGVVKTKVKKYEEVVEKYRIIDVEIESFEVKGAWNHWRGQIDIFGKQLTNEPHRFLSMEKVYITVKMLGGVEKVILDMSEELKSMKFTDKEGDTYYYKEIYGYEVYFPVELEREGDNIYRYEYILPLAPSTKDEENKRKRESYYMEIRAIKGDKVIKKRIEDIDITGNVFDHVYIETTIESID